METKSDLREITSNAIRFWETGRIAYNLVLVVVVGFYFVAGWPGSRQALTMDGVFTFILLAVMANLLYCAAYLPDFFAQLSAFRQVWLKLRFALLALGVLVAAILTRWVAMGMLGVDFVK